MGYGDLLLITVLGFWLGPLKVLCSIFFAALLGLFYWLILTILKGYEKNKKLPFGTFLIITSILLYIIKIEWDLFKNF